MHYGYLSNKREKGTESLFEEIISTNFGNLRTCRFKKLNEPQLGKYKETYTENYYNKTATSQRQRVNLEIKKRKVTQQLLERSQNYYWIT